MKNIFSKLQEQAKSTAQAWSTTWTQRGQTPIAGPPPRPGDDNTSSSAPGSTHGSDKSHEDLLKDVNEQLALLLAGRLPAYQEHFAGLKTSTYTTKQEVRVWAGTFNVHNTLPRPDDDLRSWLMHPGEKWPPRSGDVADWAGPDLLFIGFQEVNALSAVNVVAGTNPENVIAWNAAIGCALNQSRVPARFTEAQAAEEGLTRFSSGMATGTPSSQSSNVLSGTAGFGAEQLQTQLAPHQRYVQLGGRVLVGIYLSVWARVPLVPHITAWQDAETKCGALGFGNKGAVGVRLRVYDEPMCVVCCHLASGSQPQDELKRVADFVTIRSNMHFSASNTPNINGSLRNTTLTQGRWARSSAALEQPNVILMGDLNFRLRETGAQADGEARRLIRANRLDQLTRKDQLAAWLTRPDSPFAGWLEMPLTFPPTYKYKKRTDRYVGDGNNNNKHNAAGAEGAPETLHTTASVASSMSAYPAGGGEAVEGQARESPSGSEVFSPPPVPSTAEPAPSAAGAASQRVLSTVSSMTARTMKEREALRTPAWTDRVLYRRSQPPHDAPLHELLYARSELNLSDHRPVMAAFLLHADILDHGAIRTEFDNVRRALDLAANNAQPRVALNCNEVDFGTVSYNSSIERRCELSNIGQAAAEFRVLNLDVKGRAVARPSWLAVAPDKGLLLPDQTTTIKLAAVIGKTGAAVHDRTVAQALVDGVYGEPCKLAVTLVLRLRDGADHFLLVDGTFEPSIFGLRLDSVAKLFNRADDTVGLPRSKGCVFAEAPFDGTAWEQVPQALQHLLAFLAKDESLATPDLISDSLQILRAECVVNGTLEAIGAAQLPKVHAVVTSLESGNGLPDDVKPHEVAATLLGYFKVLPAPFIPATVVEELELLPLTAGAGFGDLIRQHLSAEAWATMTCVIHVVKLVLWKQLGKDGAKWRPTHHNELTERLTSALAEAWFPPLSLKALDEKELYGNYALLLQRAAERSKQHAAWLASML